MKIFGVSNTARLGYFCIAPDEATAKRLALEDGHAHVLDNLRARDVTQSFIGRLGVSELLVRGQAGRIVGVGRAGFRMRWILLKDLNTPNDPRHDHV